MGNETAHTLSGVQLEDDRCVQPARLTSLPSQFKHCVHCYHTVDAWSRDGRFMLYAGFDTLEQSSIVIRDTTTGEERTIAQTRVADFHTSSGQRWALDDRAVLFKWTDEDGVMYPALVHLDQPGDAQPLTHLPGRSVRHIIDHGPIAIASTNADAPASGRVERINLETGEAETLLEAEQALEVLPDELRHPDGTWFFNHPMPNADESMYFCKLMRRAEGQTGFVAFYVFEPATGAVRCFGDRISGHPVWADDGQHIINIKSPRDGSDNRHLVLVNGKTGEDRRIVDLPIEGPGHPDQSPDGRFIVTDAFVPNGDQSPIYLIDLQRHQAFEIARVDHLFKGGRVYDAQRITRGQPHPVWSPCGTKILINHNHAGDHFGLVLLEDFLRNT
ncbi:MAG: TolB family protein [Phycisphaeraceae bacterium]